MDSVNALLNNLSVRHKIVLLITINCVFVLLFYFGIIVPQQEKIAEAVAQNGIESQRVKTVEAFAASKPNLDQYLTELDSKLIQINSMLPNDPEMSEFLRQAEQYARETGVVLSQLHTGQIAAKNGYREIPLDIAVTGSYLQTVNFIKKLEEGSRFSVVRNIQMNSQSKESQFSQMGAKAAPLQLGTQQTMIASKLSAVIFGYGVPPKAKKDGQNEQVPNGQQNVKK